MAHGDAREEEWKENWRMEWVASPLHTASHYLGTYLYPALLPLMCTPRLPAVDWTDAPTDLNGLVRFAERPNLVSARVSSHFKGSLFPSIFHGWALLVSVFTVVFVAWHMTLYVDLEYILILLWYYIVGAKSDVLWMLGPSVVFCFVYIIEVLAVVH